jgi:ribosome assembly protein RRB1
MKHRNDRFPFTAYMCAGTQASKKHENKILVMKWSEMHRVPKDNLDEDSSEDEEDENKDPEPVMRFESVAHKGCVNRIRSMHGSAVVATWSEDGEVGFYDVTQAVQELDKPQTLEAKK